MKFSEMPYERPDMSTLKEQFAALTERLQNAPDYAAARAAFLEEQVLNKHVDTLFTLASVRHTIDTRDKFYDEEYYELTIKDMSLLVEKTNKRVN